MCLKERVQIRSKVEFVEVEEGLFLVPLKTLKDLRGSARNKSNLLIQAAKELETEHRKETRKT